MIEIVDPRPASDEALARAESELGFPLPPEYRSWLCATGAGQPTQDLEIRNGVVSEFYEVEPRGVTYSLTSVRRDRTPTRSTPGSPTTTSWSPRAVAAPSR